MHVHRTGWDHTKTLLFFLMGFLPLALPRFGRAAIHASAFGLDDGSACLVMGDSGSGKTTMLARGLASGRTFLADDACAIDPAGSLWPAAPVYAGRDDRSGDLPDYIGKTVHRAERVSSVQVPVRCSIVMAPAEGADLEVETIDGRDRLTSVMKHNRSAWLFTTPDDEALRLTANVTLASRPMGILRYDRTRHPPTDVGETLDRWVDGLVSSGRS